MRTPDKHEQRHDNGGNLVRIMLLLVLFCGALVAVTAYFTPASPGRSLAQRPLSSTPLSNRTARENVRP